jgi:hypothetical protein
MITGQALRDPLEEEETASCEDFSFEAGVAYIPLRPEGRLLGFVFVLRPFRQWLLIRR